MCVVNRRQQNGEERSGFKSRRNPDNQKRRREGMQQRERVGGTKR